jgi:3-dehydroquinate synthase
VTLETRWLRAAGRDVPLLAGPGALTELPRTLDQVGFRGRLFIVGDTHALTLHGASIHHEAPTLSISGDEQDKTLAAVSRVWDWLVDNGAQRSDALLAFGGGVVCDLVGFAAAAYMRGIGLINAPTTLLAQVDASVGGKTGVNHARGKNLIGAFYQPLCVVADTSLLATLSSRAFAAGMAEVVKMAMIMDADLFERLEGSAAGLSARDAEGLTPFVGRSIELKATIVGRDERESGDRMLLNYGHTVGHALESSAGYGGLLHGEAVAVGMTAAAFIAERLNVLDSVAVRRQRDLLRSFGLPLSWKAPTEDVIGRLSLDKKRSGSRQRWVLANRIGAASVRDDVPEDLAHAAIAAVTSA